MSSPFLFNRLFESRKTGGRKLTDHDKQIKKLEPKDNTLPSEKNSPKEDVELFATKLASQVYKTGKMGGITLPPRSRWAVAKKEDGKITPGTIETHILPSVTAFIAKSIPDNLQGKEKAVKNIFISHLKRLISGELFVPKENKAALGFSNAIIKTDDGLETTLRDLAGIRFKSPVNEPSLNAYFNNVAEKALSMYETVGISLQAIHSNTRLKELTKALQTMGSADVSKLQFLPLSNKTVPANDKEAQQLQNKKRMSNRALLAYMVGFFPFIEKSSVEAIFNGTGNFFPSIMANYQGTVLNSAAGNINTDFQSCVHITDPTIKNLVLALQKTEGIKEAANKLLPVILESITKNSILSPLLKRRIAKSIYYSAVASMAPKVLNFGEIDDEKFFKAETRNMMSTSDYLSQAALDNLLVAIKDAEEDPALLQGLHGKNARQVLAMEIHRGRKAAGLFNKGIKKGSSWNEADIASALKVVLNEPAIKKVESAIITWVQSEDIEHGTEEFMRQLRSLLDNSKQELLASIKDSMRKEHTISKEEIDAMTIEEVIKYPRYEISYALLDVLLTKFTSLTKEDLTLILDVKEQLSTFYALGGIGSREPDPVKAVNSETGEPIKNDDGKYVIDFDATAAARQTWKQESITNDDLRNNYAITFKEFQQYLDNLAGTEPKRHSAISSIMSLLSLDRQFDGALELLHVSKQSKQAIDKAKKKMVSLANSTDKYLSSLINSIDLSKLFSSEFKLNRLDKLVSKYATFVLPANLKEPLQVGTSQITPASSVEDIKSALLSLLGEEKAPEEIVAELKSINFPVIYEKAANTVLSSIIKELENPVVILGRTLTPFEISKKTSPGTLTSRLKEYIKKYNLDDAYKIIRDLMELPVRTSDTVDFTKSRQEALDKIYEVFSTYSPVAISAKRAKTSDDVRTNRRKEAQQKEKIYKSASHLLSQFLVDILSAVENAPAEVQFALKGVKQTNPDVIYNFLFDKLETIVNSNPELALLFEIDDHTLDFAVASAAKDIEYQANQGIVYKNSQISPVQAFDTDLPESLGVVINLAAALKNYNGVIVKDGYLVYDFDFDQVLGKKGILNIIEKLDREFSVSSRVATSTITKLCVQRFFFGSIKRALEPLATSISTENFIDSSLLKTLNLPILTKDIENFVSGIKEGPQAIDDLLANIDARIIVSSGGMPVSLLTKNDEGDLIIDETGASVTIPTTSTDANFLPAITKIAFAVIQELGTSPEADNKITKKGRYGAIQSFITDLVSSPELATTKLQNAINLIQNIITIEIGKKYAEVDSIVSNASLFLARELPDEEQTEELLSNLTTLRGLTGSLDASLDTKHELTKQNQRRDRTNPLISKIMGMFSIDDNVVLTPEGERNKEYEQFVKNAKYGFNTTDYAAMHSPEKINVSNPLQLAQELGVAFVDLSIPEKVLYRELQEEIEDSNEETIKEVPVKRVAKPESVIRDKEGNIVKINFGSSFFVNDTSKTGRVIKVNVTKATEFKSTARRLHGGYMGPTTRGGFQYQRFKELKSYRQMLKDVTSSIAPVLDSYSLLYDIPELAEQKVSMALFNQYLASNVNHISNSLLTLGKETESKEPFIGTLEGQKELLNTLSLIVPIESETIEKSKTTAKGKPVTKKLKLSNPIELVLENSISTEAIEEYLNTSGASVTRALYALSAITVPVNRGTVTWETIKQAYESLTEEDKQKAVAEFSSTDEDPTKAVWYFSYVVRGGISLITSEIKEIARLLEKARKEGKVTPEFTFGSIPNLLTTYASLFSSTSTSMLSYLDDKEEAAEIMKALQKLAMFFASLITREEQVRIEQEVINTKAVNKFVVNSLANGKHIDPSSLGTETNLTNPFNAMGSYVAPNPADLQEAINYAVSLLEKETLLTEAIQETKQEINKQIASALYMIAYNERFTEGQASTYPSFDFSSIIPMVADYLWITPLLAANHKSVYNQIVKLRSFFNRKDTMEFVLADDTAIFAQLNNFTALANVASHYKKSE